MGLPLTSASTPSHVDAEMVKSARPLYTASYAAASSTTFLKSPLPPSPLITVATSDSSLGVPKPAYVLPSRSFGVVMLGSSAR